MKRKPYHCGRSLGRPPDGWERQAKKGWLAGDYGFVSLIGKVQWARGRWNARLRYTRPLTATLRRDFARPRQAMAWVEEQARLRDRRRPWYVTTT